MMHNIQVIMNAFGWGMAVMMLLLVWAALILVIFYVIIYGTIDFALHCRQAWRVHGLNKRIQRHYRDK